MTDIRTEPVELPTFSLAALVEWEGVGEPHLALRPAPVWREPAEQAALTGAALEALAGAGVLTGPGQVDQNLRDLLPLLAAPATEYHGWFTVDGRTTAVLAAAGGFDAVLAVRAGDTVRLEQIAPDRLLPALLAELPEVAPHPVGSLTVTAADLAELHAPAEATERRVPPHVTELLRLLNQPVLDGGELYTASRDQLGRCVTRGPVRYADTARGRHLNYTLGTGDHLRIMMASATPDSLAAALQAVGVVRSASHSRQRDATRSGSTASRRG